MGHAGGTRAAVSFGSRRLIVGRPRLVLTHRDGALIRTRVEGQTHVRPVPDSTQPPWHWIIEQATVVELDGSTLPDPETG